MNLLSFKLSNILILFFIILTIACANPVQEPIKQAKKNEENKKDQNNDKPVVKITCEQRWTDLLLINPLGRQTTYQEQQKVILNGTTTVVLAQSFISKTINENSIEKLAWFKKEQTLLPEVGKSEGEASIFKANFIQSCNNGVNLKYTDRPFGLKPNFYENIKLKVQDVEYDVVHEKYILSRGNLPTDLDELNIWVGAKNPYMGLIFKMQRRFFKLAPMVSENFIEKDLQELKDI